LEKQIITSRQFFAFSSLSILGGSILVISSTLAAVAKQDAWISTLITMIFGVSAISLYCYLCTRYSGLTLIGTVRKILGKWIGGLVSAFYVFTFFVMSYAVPWWIGSFGSHAMPETPIPVILLPYVVGIVVSVYYGIETIARASEIFFYFVTALFAVAIILVLPNIHTVYLTPVFENGMIPVLKGAYVLSPFLFLPAIALLMIYPVNVDHVAGGRKALLKGYIWSNAVVFVTILASLLVLGTSVVAKSPFPTVLLAREINIGTVLTRLEYVVSVMWNVSEFVIGLMFYYVFIKSLSELIGLKDHKKIAIPAGLIVLLYAWLVNPSSEETSNWLFTGFIPNATVFTFVLPIVIWGIYIIKKYVFKKP
jgi:spore germination protein KB